MGGIKAVFVERVLFSRGCKRHCLIGLVELTEGRHEYNLEASSAPCNFSRGGDIFDFE